MACACLLVDWAWLQVHLVSLDDSYRPAQPPDGDRLFADEAVIAHTHERNQVEATYEPKRFYSHD